MLGIWLLLGPLQSQAQIPSEYQGEWKFERSEGNNNKKFVRKTRYAFCGDSVVVSVVHSKITGTETKKVGIVKEWGDSYIAVEYLEVYRKADSEKEAEFVTLYSEPEFLFISDKKRSRMTVSFSRFPRIAGKIEYDIIRVSSDETCMDILPVRK